MKIINITSKNIYDVELSRTGENSMPCPECSKDRKKKKAKSFSFNVDKKAGYCHNCNTAFAIFDSSFKKKEYVLPEWKNITTLSDKAVKWFETRGISQTTLRNMKIYSDTEFMPQIAKETEVICYPYFIDETLVNVKYRGVGKIFKLSKDAELIFFNINCIRGKESVIIVEGEMDCLAFIEAGYDNCISVPNGAGSKNLEYIDNYIDLFEKLQEIYIAVDTDLKGFELRSELIRRLGAEKCKIVDFDDCKDANEYLIKYGSQTLKEKVTTAKFLSVDGIIDIEDCSDDCYNLYLNGMQKGATIGIEEIDNLITWELGRLITITGIPSHGKSEFVDYIITKLNLLYGWRVGYFSPENYPFKYHFSKIASKLIGKSFDAKFMNKQEYDNAFLYISNNFHFVYPEDDMSFENIISKAKYLVKRYGIRQFVIDPYNKIEHLRKSNESETDYISRFLDAITIFAKKYQLLFWLVAHPRKMSKDKTGAFEIPSLYDINGSANFYNKTDYGITLYRNYQSNLVEIYIQKVKFKHLGESGMVQMKYNWKNGRFENQHLAEGNFDNKPYIKENCEVINYNTVEQETINYSHPSEEEWTLKPPW